jgi:alkylated DNA repair protein alkB family protein 1
MKVQLRLLGCLFHRDLSNPVHKTNVHLHHHVTYPRSQPNVSPHSMTGVESSFFSEPQDEAFPAKDSKVHKDLTMRDFLNRKLRWITLGGQYNWTQKIYPSGAPPPFPSDIAGLLHSLFSDMVAQAAIVNLYSPGDTLSLHRDVSEFTDRGLVSISLGCDAIFVIGNKEGHAIKLRSGDAVFMTGEARFAWHGVPKILKSTCPDWMEAWPAEEGKGDFEAWRGWMSNKRINLNMRQMHETPDEDS